MHGQHVKSLGQQDQSVSMLKHRCLTTCVAEQLDAVQVDVKGVTSPEFLEVTWRNGAHHATLFANLKECTFHMEATRFEDTEGTHVVTAHLQDEDLSKPVGWAVEGA